MKMILENLKILSETNETCRSKLQRFINSKEENVTELFSTLADLAIEPTCTEGLFACFPSLGPALLSFALKNRRVVTTEEHRRICLSIARGCTVQPSSLKFALSYFENYPAPFQAINGKKKFLPKSPGGSNEEIGDKEMLWATYTLLSINGEFFWTKWNCAEVFNFLQQKDPEIKWLALNILCILLKIPLYMLWSFAKQFFEENFSPPPLQTSKTLSIQSNSPALTPSQIYNLVESTGISTIFGIPVLKNPTNQIASNLTYVATKNTVKNLRKIAIGLMEGRVIHVEGEIGIGKTFLIENIARTLGNRLVKVQMGEDTDAKGLIGCYKCTEIPGEFTWRPGILQDAVTQGHWLLLEDFDQAPTDVKSLITVLSTPGLYSVKAIFNSHINVHENFRLFLTSKFTEKSQNLSEVKRKFISIQLNKFETNEFEEIVKESFKNLESVAQRIVAVFEVFYKDDEKKGRRVTLRDLMKWCERIQKDFDVSSPECAIKMFQDAVDLFCCWISDKEQRLNFAILAANTLGIVHQKAEHYLEIHRPVITVHKHMISFGRSNLPKQKHPTKLPNFSQNNQAQSFSFTRPTSCLLEKISICISKKEPVLLVGETGTGKTSSVQFLAEQTGNELIVVNMNQQSEATDLIGGFRPMDVKLLVGPIREEFEILFKSYFAVEPNLDFLKKLGNCYSKRNWRVLVTLMLHCTQAAVKRIRSLDTDTAEVDETSKKRRKFNETNGNSEKLDNDARNSLSECSVSKKRRKVDKSDRTIDRDTLKKWTALREKLFRLDSKLSSKLTLAFSFVEGSLIKAIRNGYWILLDEINLATSETLEYLSTLLENTNEELTILENKSKVKIHENFRIFACMNPATDAGKKELPSGIRNRFTEFFADELTDESDIKLLTMDYLKNLNPSQSLIKNIVSFYLKTKKEANQCLLDGTGQKPHFSLRSLCRALRIVSQTKITNLDRNVYESFCVAFLTQLDQTGYEKVRQMILGIVRSREAQILKTEIAFPKGEKQHHWVNIEGFWIRRGDEEPEVPKDYIITETVKRNLRDLGRIVSLSTIPVLLQGDTSVGKTSLIAYLAKVTGNRCLRINNHEHTDLQEYIGSYTADAEGKLYFKEGVLVDAMRKGQWLILDELNLAPSDVLEALNRLLDDNRSLFIPEIQTTVAAHANFRLFATQNPPGVYAGRKVLSRAFRNRFVELHFCEIGKAELEIILKERCGLPQSYCKEVGRVMEELEIRRRQSATFAGKRGFVTLRDLFRWAHRYSLAPESPTTLYDWRQHMADEGFLVLSAKLYDQRNIDELIQVLRKHFKRTVNPLNLFSLHDETSQLVKSILECLYRFTRENEDFGHIVWTSNLLRTAVLILKSAAFKEPVLLIGETGCGKTTVAQLLSRVRGTTLYSINCHMNSEAQDFIGGLRPSRQTGKLFEWVDGPLVQAVKRGGVFLADEINLADDSVLERMNSLLETERKLLVTEQQVSDSPNTITAHEDFLFVATMNPAGDYGKKELSPALKNRFTEIWCDSTLTDNDLFLIATHNLKREAGDRIARCMVDFLNFMKTSSLGRSIVISTRDLLSWIDFVNNCQELRVAEAYYHGACLCFLDGIGCGNTSDQRPEQRQEFSSKALSLLNEQCRSILTTKTNDEQIEHFGILTETLVSSSLIDSDTQFGIHPFFLRKGSKRRESYRSKFDFHCITTMRNTMRILRALRLRKPILIEGSPGVGKTSLIEAIGERSGFEVVRINLSDQTDVSDLFGADLPVENGKPGEFEWRDGPLLRALKNNQWILLDELNLASQSVLEGLNACFDHRSEVFIPEISKTFKVGVETKIFACQNPFRQGGARRGLPKSFLNRFTQVFVDDMSQEDYVYILENKFKEIPREKIVKMIEFNERIKEECGKSFGFNGSPFEFNLRDLTRWCELLVRLGFSTLEGAEIIYFSRFRCSEDEEKAIGIYKEVFNINYEDFKPPDPFPLILTPSTLKLGSIELSRDSIETGDASVASDEDLLVLRSSAKQLKYLATCMKMGWLCILVGPSTSGKFSLVRSLTKLLGKDLHCLPVNSAMDTIEILGGFEQTDYNRHLEDCLSSTEQLLLRICRKRLALGAIEQLKEHYGTFARILESSGVDAESRGNGTPETEQLLLKAANLRDLILSLKGFDDDSTAEFSEIEAKLEKLITAVKEEKCLNAGGKFEWVESKLVKCVRNGGWLTLTTANLATPALLDRLNALLEPHGVLSVGEKGTNRDGSVECVEKHPAFRIVMTVDPKYGEISRAMRNRGIEVYVPPVDPIKPSNLLDLRSILHNLGLSDLNLQDQLIQIYQNSSDTTKNVVDTFRVATNFRQKFTRGFGLREAFYESLVDIFGEREFDIHYEKALNLDLEGLTPSMKFVRKEGETWRLRTEGFLLDTAIRIMRNPEQAKNFDLERFFGCDFQVKEISVLSRHILMDFCQRSSKRDIEDRYKYLMTIVSNNGNDLSFFQREKIHKIYETIRNSNWTVTNNNLMLMVYFVFMIEDDFNGHQRNTMTLYEYSDAVNKGELSSQLKGQFLITYFSKILSESHLAILRLILDDHFLISNEMLVDLMQHLKYLKRFKLLGNLKLIDKRRSEFLELRETSSLLHLHFKWLNKSLISKFTDSNLENIADETRASFENMRKLHNEFLLENKENKFEKLKNSCKFTELQRARLSESSVELSRFLLQIRNKVELIEDDFSDRKKLFGKVHFLCEEETLEMKLKLIDILENSIIEKQIDRRDFFGEAQDLLLRVKQRVELNQDVPINEQIKIWKFYKCLFLMFSRLLIGKASQNLDGYPTETLQEFQCNYLEDLLQKFKNIPIIPSGIFSVIKLMFDDDLQIKQRLFLLTQLFSNFVEFEQENFIAKASGFLLSIQEENIDKEQIPLQLSEELTEDSNNALMLLVFDFLRDNSRNKFSSYQSAKNQLEILHKMIFVNSSILFDKNFDVSQNNIAILRLYIEKYLSTVNKIDDLIASTWKNLNESEKEDFKLKFLDPVKQLSEIKETLDSGSKDKLSRSWILIGYLILYSASSFPFIDPIEKQKLKVKYTKENIDDLELSLKVEDIQSLILYDTQRTEIYRLKREELKNLSNSERISRDTDYKSVSRSSSNYQNLKEDVSNFYNNFINIRTVFQILEKIRKATEDNDSSSQVLRELELWRKSLERFGKKLEKFMPEFPDFVTAIHLGISCLKTGILSGIDFLKDSRTQANEILNSFLIFPVFSEHQSFSEFLTVCFSNETMRILDELKKPNCDRDRLQLLKIYLHEVNNYSSFNGRLNEKLRADLNVALFEILDIWKRQEERKKQKQSEEDSLFKTQTFTPEVDEEDYRKYFPDHLEDFLQNPQEEVPAKLSQPVNEIISVEDCREIVEIHSSILKLSGEDCKDNQENFVENLQKRFNLLKSFHTKIPSKKSENLSSSFNILLGELRDTSNKHSSQSYNFYVDPNIEEIENCRDAIDKLFTRVNELLTQWPDNPILLEINQTVTRILSFEINSPLSRFLYGFELLLNKIQSWEENAHSEVSLLEFLEYFGKKILDFRKLEVNRWYDSLQFVENDLKVHGYHFYFFIFDMIYQISDESNSGTSLELFKDALDKFLMAAPLIEFESRLKLLLLFSEYVDNYMTLDSSENSTKSRISSVLYNLYGYYSQYLDIINHKLHRLGQPLKQKLRDTINISKWSDSRFHFIKTATEKTRKTLHKLIKQFKEAVLTSVSTSHLNLDHLTNLVTEKSNFDMAKFELKILEENVSFEMGNTEDRIKFKSTKFLRKVREFVFKVVSTSKYCKLRSDLEEFFLGYYEESRELGCEYMPNASASKEQQREWMKTFAQRRRKTLMNYLKELSNIGVSFRQGILKLKNCKSEIFDFNTEKINFKNLEQCLSCIAGSSELKLCLDNAGDIYFRCLAYMENLEATLSSGSQKLKLDTSEKLRGFTAHFAYIANQLKNEISLDFANYLAFGLQIANLEKVLGEAVRSKNTKNLFTLDFDQSEFYNSFHNFETLLVNLEIGLRQVEIYLARIPRGSYNEILNLNIQTMSIFDSENVLSNNLDCVILKIRETLGKVREIQSQVKPLSLTISNLENGDQKLIFHGVHHELIKGSLNELQKVKKTLKEVCEAFRNNHARHHIVDTVENLIEMTDNYNQEFAKIQSSCREENSQELVENFEENLENLIEVILLVIQKKYKNIDEEPSDNSDTELEKDLFTKKFLLGLKKEILDLHLERVKLEFANLAHIIYEADGKSANLCLRLLLKNLPIFSQYSRLCLFYMSEKLNAFAFTVKSLYLQLKVFRTIAQQGFCEPEQEEKSQENSAISNRDDPCGLSEGQSTENAKDISDQIEDEDQLEDAKKEEDYSKEKEDKNENKGNKSEGGIEMSENFEAESEELDNESDEENLNKEELDGLEDEFGKTGKTAEELDEEMWGDEEKNEEGNEESQEEKTGGGKTESREELSAKESENKAADEDEYDGEGDKEKEKSDVNEMEDQDVNDDQIDPYHFNNAKEIEPEEMDLPDDLNLDEDMGENEKNESQEENPFGVDEMKKAGVPEIKDNEEEENDTKAENEKENMADSSDDEEATNNEGEEVSGSQEVPEENIDKEEKAEGEDESESNNETSKDVKERCEDPLDNQDEDTEKNEETLNEDRARPSQNDSSKEVDAAQGSNEPKSGSKDAVASKNNKTDDAEDTSIPEENDNKNECNRDKETGQSKDGESQGESASTSDGTRSKNEGRNDGNREERKKPGKSDKNRSLTESSKNQVKKLKILNKEEVDDAKNEAKEQDSNEPTAEDTKKEGELFEHSKNLNEYDEIAMDAATEEQTKKKIEGEKEEVEDQKENSNNNVEEIEMHEDKETSTEDVEEKEAEEFRNSKKKNLKNRSTDVVGNAEEDKEKTLEEDEVEIEGINVDTMKIDRPSETTYHTNFETLGQDSTSKSIEENRRRIEQFLQSRREIPEKDFYDAWMKLNYITRNAARDLSEKLRLVLEPTLKSRLKGDYRTGKRLNMRKIIPYVASDFRRDKIWLRRTKPSRRGYQIIVAVDDSSSMAGNRSQELAFESLSLISQGLTLLEAGDLSILSFGEDVEVLHPLGESFNEDSGARLLQRMTFTQKQTAVGHLVNYATDMFLSQPSTCENSRLLVILSDGRGVFSEGTDKVAMAVRRARLQNIFIVFVIVDNPLNKDSILDIRMPVFQGGKLTGIKSYMDTFPFPFYIILRDLSMLPSVLGDALRQWFEIVGRIDA